MSDQPVMRVIVPLSVLLDELRAIPDSIPVKTAITQMEEMRDLLRILTYGDDCHLESNGFCFPHGWFKNGQCPHARAKEIVAS